MDHETAVQSKATERYFLGELDGGDREGFEEHFFTCPECAEDVRALTVFAANARAALWEEAKQPSIPAFLSSRALWLSAAMNIALLAALGYFVLKFAPQVKQELAEARAPQFVQDVPVLGVSRGDSAVREIAPTTRRIVFSFYLPEQFQSIAYQIKDDSGSIGPRVILPAPPKEDSSESHFSLPTNSLKPGAYEIAFWGTNGASETPIGQSRFKIAGLR